MRALADAFHQDLPTGTFGAYVEHLSDIPPEALDAAVRALIRTTDRFPSIRAVRVAAAELALRLPDERAALAQVENRLAWVRADPRPPQPPAAHPLVLEALNHVGGVAGWRSASEPGVIRGQFLRLFREARDAAIRETVVGDFPSRPQPKELPA